MGQIDSSIGRTGSPDEARRALGEKLIEVAAWSHAEKDIKELMGRTDAMSYAGIANYKDGAAIMSAIRAHTYDNLKPLVSYGANLNAAAPASLLPLHYLARAGGARGVPVFKELGADMNIKDRQGKNAYFYTSDPETIVALAKSGVKADPAINGDTPLTRMDPARPNINLMAVYSAVGYALPEQLQNIAKSLEHAGEFKDLKDNYVKQMGLSMPASTAPAAPVAQPVFSPKP